MSALSKLQGVLRHSWVAVVVALAIGVGWLLRAGLAPAPADGAAMSSSSAPAIHGLVTTWTCAMHSQIQRDGPGLCPICGMELVPVGGSVGRRLEISAAARELMRLETSPVERRSVEAEVRLVGKLEPDETRVSTITSWVAGRLDRVHVDFTGIEVREGDPMVYVFSPEVTTAQEELLQARRAAARVREGDARYEEAQATLGAARDKLRNQGLSEAQVAEVEKRGTASDHVTIHAPQGGVVIRKNALQGEYVERGTPIYTIADLSHLWVQLDAYESDLELLGVGQRVDFTTEAFPGESFQGPIAFLTPEFHPVTHTVKVRVEVANPEGRLRPGMFVHATVRAPMDATGGTPAEPPLVVPATAPLYTGTRAVVYVELPGTDAPTYEGREVVLGPRAGAWIVIEDGLEEGELVVTHGAFKLDSELQIRARPSMMSPSEGASEDD